MARRDRVLCDLLWEAADRAPASTVTAGSDGAVSYARLAERVPRLARGLLALGLAPGDRLAIQLPKSCRIVEWLLAANLAGLVIVPVNPALRARQLRHVLRDSQARALATVAGRAELLAGVAPDCPELAFTLVAGELDRPVPGTTTLDADSLYADGPGPSRQTASRALAALFYTSGSTGLPRGVMTSNANLLHGAAAVTSVLGTAPGDRILGVLPLSFDAGFSQLTTALRAGASLILVDHLLPAETLAVAARCEASHLTGVPPLFRQLADARWPERLRETMRSFATTGGVMPLALLRRLQALMPRAQGYLMYGFTEAFRATILPPAQIDVRPDSVGLPIPGAQLFVLRPDGTRCEPGEAGELVQAGDLVSQGYWNDDAATAGKFRRLPASIDPARPRAVWSGDIVHRDEDGYFYFHYRDSELIKTSGYRVSPDEVETVLLDSGLVDEAVVTGVPSARLGEAIVALVVARNADFSPAALQEWCRRELPVYLRPSEIRVVSDIPRNPNGKYDRAAVRAALRDEARQA